jgi:hypothetical protein
MPGELGVRVFDVIRSIRVKSDPTAGWHVHAANQALGCNRQGRKENLHSTAEISEPRFRQNAIRV